MDFGLFFLLLQAQKIYITQQKKGKGKKTKHNMTSLNFRRKTNHVPLYNQSAQNNWLEYGDLEKMSSFAILIQVDI